jgi:hypothetical protein
MTILATWILFSIVAGVVGQSRMVGGWTAFLISLLLCPLIGLFIAGMSDKKERAQQPCTMMKSKGISASQV